MAYKKLIVERECEWDGVNGNHYNAIRYIEAIFYAYPKKEDKAYLNMDCNCAVVGGGSTDIVWATKFINGTLKKGQKPVTVEEIESEIEKMKAEIKADPKANWWEIPPYPGE